MRAMVLSAGRRTMTVMITPLRIEPAFDDREQIRGMFARYAPYRNIAFYGPNGMVDDADNNQPPVLPWFRGNWAVAGKPLVEGADRILYNERFLEAARAAYGTSSVHPEFVVANINAPMPAGSTHVDIPSFRGATREHYPLPLLKVMGSSGLFEAWRIIRAGVVSWFYEGEGGHFDYWPHGPAGPMRSERSPFGNVAVLADNDTMYHRIGAIGPAAAALPRISPSSQIERRGDGHWAITENGAVTTTYPGPAIRLSIVWKAEIRKADAELDLLTLHRVVATFAADLRARGVQAATPTQPLTDTNWILILQRTYRDPIESPR
jgi:hypothetical protein